jgi:hypothetical protein
VDAFDPDGSIRKVNLFWGPSILAALTNAPYLFQWTNLPPGSYTLTAQAVDDDGLIGVSSPVGFVVVPPPPIPVFIEQPVGQNVRSGSVAIFRVRAAGPQPIHYQWLFNGVPMNGATNTFLILNNVQPANAGTNTVLATNQWGSTVSQPATLSVDVTAPPAGNTNDPPSVCLSSVEILDPGVALISVNATNISVVNIEWTSNCLTWTQLLTLTNYGGALYFADPDAVSRPRRFYRAVGQL